MAAQKILTEQIVDCDTCRTLPAHVCLFECVEGRFLYYNKRQYVGHLCAVCLTRVYAQFTLRTLARGWWSIYGVYRTPCVVFLNTCEYISCRIKLRRLSRLRTA